ncbi:MAG: hypothetical protein JOZ78_26520 [Chroococcidiopsidaceae cyanobacterium CP_BM_ER_R8_30]|nr:hypothetical protein [Chroococcidiopsidaceae cyanobacterium CP_BM_ER_R8_30]
MPGGPIIPQGSPPSLATYSPGMKVGEVLYVSITLALDKEGNLVGKDDAIAQTRKFFGWVSTTQEFLAALTVLPLADVPQPEVV